MEVLGAVNNKFLVCIYEALGTALLLIALNMSGPDGGTDAQAVASSLFIGIVIFGPISGGHFNPAVTIAVWIKEAINSSQVMS
jgi:aquaporin Z